jgi:protocatechuate 3,4-dioxygenase beta subunit
MLPAMSNLDLRNVRRREALLALGGMTLGAVWGARALTGAGAATPAAAACVLSPEVTEGPYYVANHLTRRDITEGRPGLPLLLYLTVLDASTCKPIKGADVEVWHADAVGTYSGVNGSSTRFLRGHQRSDAHGRVRFDTIYPGWYRGRTPHIHLKVHAGGQVVHTGQLFFSDNVSDAVYRTSAYRSHGQRDTSNGRDMIYAQAGGSSARLKLARRSSGKGYRGSIAVGVRT